MMEKFSWKFHSFGVFQHDTHKTTVTNERKLNSRWALKVSPRVPECMKTSCGFKWMNGRRVLRWKWLLPWRVAETFVHSFVVCCKLQGSTLAEWFPPYNMWWEKKQDDNDERVLLRKKEKRKSSSSAFKWVYMKWARYLCFCCCHRTSSAHDVCVVFKEKKLNPIAFEACV